MAEHAASFVAECHRPDVTDADLETRDRRVGDATAEFKSSKKEEACARP